MAACIYSQAIYTCYRSHSLGTWDTAEIYFPVCKIHKEVIWVHSVLLMWEKPTILCPLGTLINVLLHWPNIPKKLLRERLTDDTQFQNYPFISIRRLKYSKRVHITVDRREKGIHRDTSNKLYPQGYTSSEHFLHVGPTSYFWPTLFLPSYYSSWVSINWVKLSMSQLPLEMSF